MSAEQVREQIRSGRLARGWSVRDAGGVWQPVEASPFADLLGGGAYGGRSTGGSETAAILLLLAPLVGGVVILVVPLVLGLVTAFGVVITMATLVVVDASALGMGRRPNRKGKMDSGPATWALAVLLFPFIAVPWFLATRAGYGRTNYAFGGALTTLFFCAVAFASSYLLGA